MVNDFLNASPCQQCSQLNLLGSEQLNQLIDQLEVQKKKLPVEEHSIIDWGVNLVRAKLQEEMTFMREIEQQWIELREKYSDMEKYVENSEWRHLNLKSCEGKDHLYNLARSDFLSIIQLSVKEGRIRDNDFEGCIKDIKRGLHYICEYMGEPQLYSELIADYRADFYRHASNEEFSMYWIEMDRVLGENLS
ncbi:MAG: hypothetical protein WBA10_17755 [Elainellaceae cyanobacterium]